MAIGRERSLVVAGMIGTAAGLGFIVVGLGIQQISIPGIDFSLGHKGEPDTLLTVIGLLCAMQSFALYRGTLPTQGPQQN